MKHGIPVMLSAVLSLLSAAGQAQEDARMQHARHLNSMMHGGMSNWLLMADRLELARHDGKQRLQWEAQGWYGTDEHKLWLKSEGDYHRAAQDTEHAELQLLYSRPVAAYWDLQAGLRHDDGAAGSVAYAAFGILGLAPYWFETDAALFVSEQGKWSARLEVEYELRFTQRLILQPRLELNHAFAAAAEAGVQQGFHDNSFGLRLRYEVLRELAPYVGVEWWQARGASAAQLQRAGQDAREARVVAGLRFWY
jgi:copper resistance protein B